MISFEWDEEKNKTNKIKHGVSFEEAKTVFFDENAWLEYDDTHSAEEDRFRILGSSFAGNVLLVVHCIRKESVIRIISSRKATSVEKANYEELKNEY